MTETKNISIKEQYHDEFKFFANRHRISPGGYSEAIMKLIVQDNRRVRGE